MLSAAQISRFHADGYLLIKQVFTAAEMAAFQHAGRASLGPGKDVAHLFDIDGTRRLWRDPRLVSLATQLLGGSPIFFGEANYHYLRFQSGQPIKGRHLHHDAKGRPEHLFNRVHDVLPETYPVLRCGLYFQDYRAQSGGLKVSPGSHRIATSKFDNSIAAFDIPSEPGDLVVFTMRTLHSPFALRLKSRPEEALLPWQEDRIYHAQPESFIATPLDRETIFVDYAKQDVLADIHIKSRAINPANAKKGLARHYTDELSREAEAAGLKLRLDYSIVETATTIASSFKSNGKLSAAALEPVLRLAKLCSQHTDGSPYFRLFQGPVIEISTATGIQLFKAIWPALFNFRSQLETRQPDWHMGYQPGDLA